MVPNRKPQEPNGGSRWPLPSVITITQAHVTTQLILAVGQADVFVKRFICTSLNGSLSRFWRFGGGFGLACTPFFFFFFSFSFFFFPFLFSPLFPGPSFSRFLFLGTQGSCSSIRAHPRPPSGCSSTSRPATTSSSCSSPGSTASATPRSTTATTFSS